MTAALRGIVDEQAIEGRVERHRGGSGRCVKFASVWYAPANCNASMHGDVKAIDDEASLLPSIVTHTMRTPPDNFEAGPSYSWRHLNRWDYRVRCKFLMGPQSGGVPAIHSCCRPYDADVSHALDLAGSPPRLETACAAVEHVPLEAWTVRHLRPREAENLRRTLSGGSVCLRTDVDPELRRPGLSQMLDAKGGIHVVPITPELDVHDPLPRAWADEANAAHHNLLSKALKAKPNGGDLTFKTYGVRHTPR